MYFQNYGLQKTRLDKGVKSLGSEYLPMTSILFVIVGIYCIQFKCTYLKNKNVFVNFLLPFLNLHHIFSVLKINMTLIHHGFPKLWTTKILVRWRCTRPRLRTWVDSHHAKQSQTLLKSPRQHCYHIFLSIWENWVWKMSLLVISEILGLFVNTLTADDKYSLYNSKNLQQPIEMKLSKKERTFSQYCTQFLHQILKTLRKKMTLIAYVFPKLWTAKNVVRKMPKKPRFGISFKSQHAKGSQTLLTFRRRHFFHIFLSLLEKNSWKMSLLAIYENLQLFVNTLAVADKYFLRNSENLQQPIQMLIATKYFCNKQNTFSQFFAPFLQSTSYF